MTTLSLPGFGSICALAFADERTLVAGHSEAIFTFDVAKMRKGRALDASHHGHGVRALVVRDGGVYHDVGPNEIAVIRTPGTKPLARDAQEAAPPRRPRERKLSKNPPKWGGPEEQWTAEDHLDFREYVANEHLVGGMPIAELERNHDIPMSRVRKWIKLYEVGGRSALRGSLGALKSYR